MKLEDQVAPVALAQRMKDLGFSQLYRRQHGGIGALFVWVREGSDIFPVISECAHDGPWELICTAPTVAEMGEWLPANYGSKRAHLLNAWCAGGPPPNGHFQLCRTEAEARARLLISLKLHAIAEIEAS